MADDTRPLRERLDEQGDRLDAWQQDAQNVHDIDGVLAQAAEWLARGEEVGLATVVRTWGSSPRPAGSKLAVAGTGHFIGSVSGGCIEGAVITEALEVASGLARPHVVSFGVSDERAWEVGLACGGKIEIFVEAASSTRIRDLRDARAQKRPVALITPLGTTQPDASTATAKSSTSTSATDAIGATDASNGTGATDATDASNGSGATDASNGSGAIDASNRSGATDATDASNPFRAGPWLVAVDGLPVDRIATHFRREVDDALRGAVERALRTDETFVLETPDGPVLVEPHNPPSRLILIGAVHVAEPLAKLARVAGFAVTLVDPRRAWATPERFPDDTLVVDWPDVAMDQLAIDKRTAIVALTHDPKIDDPGLVAALKSPAFYIGCLGSKKTHAARRDRLGAQFDAKTLDRLHGPVGLDIGAKSPAEIAVSILAEILAVLRGRDPRASNAVAGDTTAT